MKLHPFDMRRRLIASAYRSKKFDKVKKLSEKYLSKYPDDVRILELLARSHVSSQEWESAYPLYKRLFNLEPEYRDVCIQYVRCSIYEQRWEQINLILEVSPNVLSTSQIQRALAKKLTSISDEAFLEFTELSGSYIDSIPIDALHRWAYLDRDLREHAITQYDEICLKMKVGGPYLGIVLGNIISKSESEGRKLIEDFVSMYSTTDVEKWIRAEFSVNQIAVRPVVNWLLELTPETSINKLYDQLASYIPMEEFVEIDHLDVLSLSVEVAHLWLVETLMLQNNSKSLQQLITRNLPNTCIALEQSLQRNINSGRYEESIWLIEQIMLHPEMLSIISLRRMIAKSMLSIGATELAYSFALSTLDQNPQDGVSAFIALNAAIDLVDDERIVHITDINLNIRNSNPEINFASIILSCLRSGRNDIALELMERFRMKMDGNGHRLRVGYQFHQLRDWNATLDAIKTTPDKFRNLSHLKLIEGAAYAMLGKEQESIIICIIPFEQ